jgi:hypothetical protein
MSDYSNEWQVEIIFEPTGDYMNFTYETDEDEEDRVVLEIMNQISVVADKVK